MKHEWSRVKDASEGRRVKDEECKVKDEGYKHKNHWTFCQQGSLQSQLK